MTEVNHILKAVCEVVKVDEGSNRRRGGEMMEVEMRGEAVKMRRNIYKKEKRKYEEKK